MKNILPIFFMFLKGTPFQPLADDVESAIASGLTVKTVEDLAGALDSAADALYPKDHDIFDAIPPFVDSAIALVQAIELDSKS